MSVETETVSTDPWKFAAKVICGDVTHYYIGTEDESRSQVKRIAIKQMEAKLAKMNASRNSAN
jgi:hypothetical protein